MGVVHTQTFAHKYKYSLADQTRREDFSTSTLFMQFYISLIYKKLVNTCTFISKISTFKQPATYELFIYSKGFLAIKTFFEISFLFLNF